MGRKIGETKRNLEIQNLAKYERQLRMDMEFMGDNNKFSEWVIGTDTKFRVNYFSSFTKAKLQRYLEYLDCMTNTTVLEYELKVIDENKYRKEMFLHSTMLMSIMDTCKTWGLNISRDWIIK